MPINKRYRLLVISLAFIIIAGYLCFLKTLKPSSLNVVLITIDSLRPDHLGCYGYGLETSPNIDGFSKKAVLFTQAITQGSKTALALPSLHTSTYPRTHGIYREGYRLNESVTTLAQILKKYDYTTMAIVCYIKHIQGLEKGFDIFNDVGSVGADKITQTAISWMEKNHQNKFFLWLHYFDTHGPYKPPSPYNHIFVNNSELNKRHIPISTGMHNCFRAIPTYIAEDNITDVDYYISQYDSEIRFTDEQIGVLLRKIKELNLDRKSIIVITADHGELLGEHELYFEHFTLYDQILKVPLLIQCEGILPASKIVNSQVRLIDIAPTILASLHIPRGRTMQGENLLSLIVKRRSNRTLYAFAEEARPNKDFLRECVRSNDWKLIYTRYNNHEYYKLYNINTDPAESNNLVKKEKGKLNFFRNMLDEWRKIIPISEPKECSPLTEETKGLLKSLGYLQ